MENNDVVKAVEDFCDINCSWSDHHPDYVIGSVAPLLQQALKALELSQPFPGEEARWSAAINAIYAAAVAKD